jgi:ABC-type multidrug transport system fused ATPase/permease subunit
MRTRARSRVGSSEPRRTMLRTVKAVLRLSSAHARLLPLLVILGLAASLAESLSIGLIVLFLYSMMGRASEAAAANGIIGKRFAEMASAEVRRTSIAFERLDALVPPVVQIGYLLLLVVIALVSDPIGVSFAAALPFVALLYRLQPHVCELQSNLLRAAQLEAPARSTMSVLDRSDKTYLTSGVTSFSGLCREIRFDAVSFTYTGALSPSLNQISFAIPAGAVTALVGMSGAGKTTIVNLLLRLFSRISDRSLWTAFASTR